MRTALRLRLNWLAAAALGLPIAVAVWIAISGETKHPLEASSAIQQKPTGYPQLISVEPLPGLDGQMCEWVPASSNMTLAAALQQESAASAVARSADQPGTSVDADRAPLRTIRDTYPTYSALAVDPNSNEVFLQDENVFGIKVFNRTDNTPSSANFTEPKRILAGLNTKLEFNCALY
ncbi:MAG: hypothetical protein HY647_06375, partial [Acidobacteria bacterium]|nr:hypothetical protein [Acidobacteriota bacterium]